MRNLLISIVVFNVIISPSESVCNLSCDTSNISPQLDYCVGLPQLAIECMEEIPFNQTWTTAILDTIISSIDNYAYLDIYKNSGPPYSVYTSCFFVDFDKSLSNTNIIA